MRQTFVQMLGLLIGIAVPLAAFVRGLRSSDLPRGFGQPLLMARSLFAILVVVPVVAAILVELLLPANPVVRAGIVVSILAIGIGTFDVMSFKQTSRDVASYEAALDTILMVLAVVYLPLAVAIHGAILHHGLTLPAAPVFRVVLLQALLPFVLGMACARRLPKVAAALDRQGPLLVTAAMVLVGFVALLATGRVLLRLGSAAWLTCTAVALLAIFIGHSMGGPARETRAVLARFSATRFPALALLLVTAVPGGKLMIPAVIAYIISSAVLVGLYLASAGRRVHTRVEARA
jgi:BASS family bile acid:Na+ symporter